MHGSRKILEMPTLGASLYLLLYRFLQRRYEDVCASAISCTFDTQLSPEEAQVAAPNSQRTCNCSCQHWRTPGCSFAAGLPGSGGLVMANLILLCPCQIFGTLDIVASDPHPNACAARLKLWLAFQVSTLVRRRAAFRKATDGFWLFGSPTCSPAKSACPAPGAS